MLKNAISACSSQESRPTFQIHTHIMRVIISPSVFLHFITILNMKGSLHIRSMCCFWYANFLVLSSNACLSPVKLITIPCLKSNHSSRSWYRHLFVFWWHSRIWNALQLWFSNPKNFIIWNTLSTYTLFIISEWWWFLQSQGLLKEAL